MKALNVKNSVFEIVVKFFIEIETNTNSSFTLGGIRESSRKDFVLESVQRKKIILRVYYITHTNYR